LAGFLSGRTVAICLGEFFICSLFIVSAEFRAVNKLGVCNRKLLFAGCEIAGGFALGLLLLLLSQKLK
jgi:hypothetical protein